jgi:Putative beta-barrel porin-2, OmpL-like. bbp2
MIKIGGQIDLRREAGARLAVLPKSRDAVPIEATKSCVHKGLLLAAAVIGFAAASSHSAMAQLSMKDGVACDPYKNYSCLDAYLGENVLQRFFNYYELEWGRATAPTDPKAPSSRIEGWPRTPATVPPMAYTEWPTGALTSIGVTRPNSVDSPLMVAIANTDAGKWMTDNHIQAYGWVEAGFNFSSNPRGKGANAPVAYTYISNTAQLDQAVLYLERLPDTVQTDHIDWGFRLSGIYGTDYRYTNSYGIASYQFNKRNNENGYDFPMEYLDVYIPWVAQGLEFRLGRYIAIPDIEAQLAPNNITYTHSLTYAWDNYTNTGIVGSLQVTKQLLVQLGVTDGTETPLWHNGIRIPNLDPNPIYPGSTYLKDPGNQPSLTACIRYTWNDGWDTLYPCLDGINNSQWGYNNVQWHGFTYYHRFNDEWHFDFESYYLSESGVPNARNPIASAIFLNGGTPFSPQNVPRNGPSPVYCDSAGVLTCSVWAIGVLGYLNYTPDPLNNFTLRLEWYDDPQGWRTSTGGDTKYYETTISWQHWFSPQLEIRPEISYWHSFGTAAFNGNPSLGIPGNKKEMVEFAMDSIIHF